MFTITVAEQAGGWIAACRSTSLAYVTPSESFVSSVSRPYPGEAAQDAIVEAHAASERRKRSQLAIQLEPFSS